MGPPQVDGEIGSLGLVGPCVGWRTSMSQLRFGGAIVGDWIVLHAVLWLAPDDCDISVSGVTPQLLKYLYNLEIN
jgi:hypothetical protein